MPALQRLVRSAASQAAILIIGIVAIWLGTEPAAAFQVKGDNDSNGGPTHQWITCQAVLKLDDVADAPLKAEISEYAGGSDCSEHSIFGLGAPIPEGWLGPGSGQIAGEFGRVATLLLGWLL